MKIFKSVIVLCVAVLVVCCYVLVATSCGNQVGSEKLDGDYEKLLADYLGENYLGSIDGTGASGNPSGDKEMSLQDFVTSVVAFEADNPRHFASKLDLGELYLSQGEYLLSWQYLQRALDLVENKSFASGEKVEPTQLERLYRLLAQLSLGRGDLAQAENYGRKALSQAEKVSPAVDVSSGTNSSTSFDPQNYDSALVVAPASYLLGHILYVKSQETDNSLEESSKEVLALEKEAINFFNKGYSFAPNEINMVQLYCYGKLLVKNNRGEEVAPMVDSFFQQGRWTIESVLMAQELLQSVGKTERGNYYEALAQEYLLSFQNADESNFSGDNIAFSWQDNYEFTEAEEVDFAKKYCDLSYKNSQGLSTKADLDSLVALEPYFVHFPAFYWLLWQVAESVLNQEELPLFVAALKKTIVLNPVGVFAHLARNEILGLLDTGINSLEVGGESNLAAGSLVDAILF